MIESSHQLGHLHGFKRNLTPHCLDSCAGTILTKRFTDRVKNTGDFLGCRYFVPLPTSNSSEFRIGHSDKLADKGPCMSAEQCQVSRRNDRLENQKDLGGIGNFYRCRLQILANLSGRSEVSKRGWRKGGCRHKMSQIHFLTTTGRSGSKRHLDEAVWVTTALVFGCCARLEHDMCINTQKNNVFKQMQAPPGKVFGQQTLTRVVKLPKI